MLKHTPQAIGWCQKPPHCRQNLIEVKKMSAQQNQLNLGKENCIPLQGMVSCLFEIVTQSADGTAKLFL